MKADCLLFVSGRLTCVMLSAAGMFKYQHVCCGSCHNFIVTCPRASMPDVEDGEAAYPASKYYDDMLSLGFDLMYATEKKARAPSFFGIETDTERDVPARARNLVMKVGLSSGPAAGVVLGACRRFYCIYGLSPSPACPSSMLTLLHVR